MDSNRILSERVVHTDAYTHDTQTLAHCIHTHIHMPFYFSLSNTTKFWEELVEWSISEEPYYFGALL